MEAVPDRLAVSETIDNIPQKIDIIGNHAIRWYGMMFALAFLTGYWIFKRYLREDKLTSEMVDSLLIYIAIGGIAGARIGHCLFYEPGYFLRNPLQILFVWKGGLASHGGIIGLFLALWLYIRKYKIPFLWLIDRIAIPVALANAFIRMGNFFNSEIYGRPTDLPWGVKFVRDRLYDSTSGELLPTVARHPTQIYEALCYLLVFIATFAFYRRKRKEIRDGYIFSISMIAQFSARFLVEFVKNDQVAFEAGMRFNMGQLLSLPFILAGIGLLIWTRRNPQVKR